jgi:hypothetical protein
MSVRSGIGLTKLLDSIEVCIVGLWFTWRIIIEPLDRVIAILQQMITTMMACQKATEACLWKMETRIETGQEQIGAEIKTGMGEVKVSSRPSVLCDRVPYAVRERYGGSSVCRQRPTSSRIYHRPGSISSSVGGALRLDAGPHVDSLVCQ